MPQVMNYVIPIVSGLAIVAAAVAIGFAIWLALRLNRLERHYKALTAGAAGGSLEAVLEDHVSQVQQATRRVQELDMLVMRLERNNRTHLQRVGFLRFNPFRDTGGDQSFALALTDEGGSGVVISSLHSREVTRVYAKPLVAWQTSYQLTEEERAAIKRAQGE
jgi:hypothetical protein